MTISSYTDYDAILTAVNRTYKIDADRIELHRDMIGHVYLLWGGGRYVLKIYRSHATGDALQTVRILQYLEARRYPAARVVPTAAGGGHAVFETPEGCCAAILFPFVEGEDPDGDAEIEVIGLQTGRLHAVMAEYPGKLIHRTKDEYIGDYIAIMNQLGYRSARVEELGKYGDELWARITGLPRGFCHGDLHTGNMVRVKSGDYVLLDFDDASGDYPDMDVAYLCDGTHFNQFSEDGYDKTLRLLDRFCRGYGKQRALGAVEREAIFDFIAVRHFQIVARIVRCQGLQEVTHAFFDEQYEWLLNWKNLCEKRRT